MNLLQSAKIIRPSSLKVEVRLPGGKSETNRALMIAALSGKPTRVHHPADCDDTQVVLQALKVLGFSIQHKVDEYLVSSPQKRIRCAERILLGNAGTAMRFLTAFVAYLSREWVELDGSEQLRRRPMTELLSALRELGAEVECLDQEGFLPFRVRRGEFGSVRNVAISGERSSQFVSALLLVAPLLPEGMRLEVIGKMVSAPYIELTLKLMKQAGIVFERGANVFDIPAQSYSGCDFHIEADASSASYFFGLAAVLGGSVTVCDLPRTTVQADIEILEHLEEMGCKVHSLDTQGHLFTRVHGPRELQGISADLSRTPDGALTLACVAAFAKSPSVFSGLSHLPHKESNRLKGLVSELRRIGVNAWCDEDKLSILPGAFRPALVKTYDDHRMAMAFSICAMGHRGIEILNPEVVRKSFPGFWDALRCLGIEVRFQEIHSENSSHRLHG